MCPSLPSGPTQLFWSMQKGMSTSQNEPCLTVTQPSGAPTLSSLSYSREDVTGELCSVPFWNSIHNFCCLLWLQSSEHRLSALLQLYLAASAPVTHICSLFKLNTTVEHMCFFKAFPKIMYHFEEHHLLLWVSKTCSVTFHPLHTTAIVAHNLLPQ